jgi:WhiB family redox-sensing transcriptional regulator
MHEQASALTSQDDWRSLGACRGEDPELFFPVVLHGPGLMQISRAKAVCARCQVRGACLRFALETVQEYGVWGGTSEEERRAARRARLRGTRKAGDARDRRLLDVMTTMERVTM